MSIRRREWTVRGGVQKVAYVVDYVDQAGKRHIKTFPTKKEAESWGVTARHEIKQGVHTAESQSRTIAEGWEAWLVDCEANGLERGTIQQRRQHLEWHVRPYIGREKLATLTMPRVVSFDEQLRAEGRSVSMRRKVSTNLKTVLSFCQTRGWVAQNVARGYKIKNDKRGEKKKLREGVDYPSRAEVRELMEKVSVGWGRAFLVTVLFTGLRASELRGLPWGNVDLDKGILHVRQRADRWGTIGAPKSAAGTRDIPLAPMVVNALRQWRASCPAGKLDLVFPNGAGNVENHSNIQHRFWEPLQIAAGLSLDSGKVDDKGQPILGGKYGFHMLRHVAASLFIAHLGWTPKRLQEVMGHSSITITFDLYGHLFEDLEGDREAMKKLEAAVVAA